jgi:hypothetical protein
MLVDLTVDMDSFPQPGETVRATLTAPQMPEGTEVAVLPAGGDAPWQPVGQTATIEDGRAHFEVAAPLEFSASVKGFEPPMEVTLRVNYREGQFVADRVALEPGSKLLGKLVPAPEPVAIPHHADKVTPDADLGEWADIPPMPRPFDGEPLSSLRLCWNEQGIYGAVDAVDDDVRGNREKPWEADAALLFIEKDFARTARRSEHVGQYAFGPAPEHGPGPAHIVVFGAGWKPEPGVQCAWRRSASGYVLEFLIPAAALAPARMEEGCIVGLDFSIQDDGEPVEQFYSEAFHDGWHSPITWGAASLSE